MGQVQRSLSRRAEPVIFTLKIVHLSYVSPILLTFIGIPADNLPRQLP